MEIVVQQQIVRYFEGHNLFSNGQHGFRKNRSTISALISWYDRCVRMRDKRWNSGTLFFDLSACFDTVSPEVLCDKLKLHGFDDLSLKWIRSFLSDRWQQVSVSGRVSEQMEVRYGCPQGSCLSPTLFLCLVADIDLWTEESKNISFADDTSSIVSDEKKEKTQSKLEKEATNILNFMAANELKANASKTGLM